MFYWHYQVHHLVTLLMVDMTLSSRDISVSTPTCGLGRIFYLCFSRPFLCSDFAIYGPECIYYFCFTRASLLFPYPFFVLCHFLSHFAATM